MAGFVQIIEWRTSRLEDVQALQDRWKDRAPSTGPDRITVCADRNRPGTYLTIAEFPSYEQAMRNSGDPTTQEFAAELAELCDGPPTFYDLDVILSDVRAPEQRSATDAAASAGV